MTNLEKIRNIEITGYKIFKKFNIADLHDLLQKYGCDFCPMNKECDDDRSGLPCHTLLLNWLGMEEKDNVVKTNMDQIKSMSYKEMGEFIYDIMTEEGFCHKCPVPSPSCRNISNKNNYENDEENNHCLSIIIEWLGSEVDHYLKPCPICGGDVKFNKNMGAIECEKCRIKMYGENYEEVIKKWNNRKGGI